MDSENSGGDKRQMILYRHSECESCDQIAAFLRGWISSRSNFELLLLPIIDEPEQVLLLNIKGTPALVVDGELLGDELSYDRAVALVNQIPD